MFLAHEAGAGPDGLVGLAVIAVLLLMLALGKAAFRGILALFRDVFAMRKKHSH